MKFIPETCHAHEFRYLRFIWAFLIYFEISFLGVVHILDIYMCMIIKSWGKRMPLGWVYRRMFCFLIEKWEKWIWLEHYML